MFIRSDGDVNIPRTIQDNNYRYHMPLIKQRIIGKGINIRTEFLNLKEVAKSLFIDVEYILKYFGQEFGSKVTLKRDPKTQEISVSSINGKLNEDDVLKMLDKFIDIFILCEKDNTPEVIITVEGDDIYGKCKSCGHVKHLDKNNKMTIYMKKNPPKKLHEIVNKEKFTNERQEQKQELPINFLKYEVRESIKNCSLNPYDEQDQENIEEVRSYLQKMVPLDQDYDFDDQDAQNLYKAVKRLRLGKDFYDKFGFIVFNYIFSENILQEIKKRGILWEHYLARQKLGPFKDIETLLNLEYFLYFFYPSIDWTKVIPTLVKMFLDMDIFSSEFLIKWEAKEEALYSRLKRHCLFKEDQNERLLKDSKALIDWLKEDEEDEEEDDEEEGDEDDEN